MILTKFGVSASFNLVWIVTADYFPVVFRSQIYGVCNLVSRMIGSGAPIMAVVKALYPMLVYIAFDVLSLFAITLLTKKNT